MADEDLEAASDLPVLDLEDTDLGVRTEDRYAAIPPGPRLVRRREHQDRDRGPAVLLLVGLAVLFAVAAWLDGISSDEPDDQAGVGPAPVLEQPTGATLLAVGNEGAVRVDVDGRSLGAPIDLGRPVLDAVLAGRILVVRGSAEGIFRVSLVDGQESDLPRAVTILPSASPARVWLIDRTDDVSVAREIDVPSAIVTGELEVRGERRFVGAIDAGLLVADREGTVELVRPGGGPPERLAQGMTFLASTSTTIATRTRGCQRDACELVVNQIVGDTDLTFDLALGTGGQEAALFSPDGRHVAVTRSDGLETFGVVVDLEGGTVARFRSRALAREANRPLAWSSDGQWLFIATERNGLDAVTLDGDVFRVDVELPATESLLVSR